MKALLSKLKTNFAKRVQSYLGVTDTLVIQLDITNSCNLRCKHCYHPHHQNEGAIDFTRWCKIFDEIENLLNKLAMRPYFILCGGEPFVSAIFDDVINELSKRWGGCEVTILTNGTMIRRERLAKLRNVSVNFQVSLDGPDAARHDAKRGTGSFERSKKGIALLKSEGFRVTSLAILSKQTANWIPEFFSLARDLKLDGMNFTRLISQGTGKNMVSAGEDEPLRPGELKRAFEDILAASELSHIPTNTEKPLFHLISDNLGSHALFGFQGIVIDYKGNLKVSSRTNFVVGNVLEQGLENLFMRHPIFVSLREGKIDGCGDCQFYKRCGGDRNAAYAEFGSFLARDPGCWFLEEKRSLKEAL